MNWTWSKYWLFVGVTLLAVSGWIAIQVAAIRRYQRERSLRRFLRMACVLIVTMPLGWLAAFLAWGLFDIPSPWGAKRVVASVLQFDPMNVDSITLGPHFGAFPNRTVRITSPDDLLVISNAMSTAIEAEPDQFAFPWYPNGEGTCWMQIQVGDASQSCTITKTRDTTFVVFSHTTPFRFAVHLGTYRSERLWAVLRNVAE